MMEDVWRVEEDVVEVVVSLEEEEVEEKEEEPTGEVVVVKEVEEEAGGISTVNLATAEPESKLKTNVEVVVREIGELLKMMYQRRERKM